MSAEISKFSKAHFRNIPENSLHFLTQILRIFFRNGRFMSPPRKLSEFLEEIPGGDRALVGHRIPENKHKL